MQVRRAFSTACIAAGVAMAAGVAQAAKDVYCDDTPVSRPKIVGGSPTDAKQWPWFAALRLTVPGGKYTQAFCGGTVIAPNWVLTAAHCLAELDANNLTQDVRDDNGARRTARLEVVIGIDDLREAAEENIYRPAAIVVHERYAALQLIYERDLEAFMVARMSNPNAQPPRDPAQREGNDIALVRLERPWNGPVAPLSLEQATDPTRQMVRVAGFGLVEPQFEGAADAMRSYTDRNGVKIRAGCARLMQVSMPLVETVACRTRFTENNPPFTPAIAAGQICAGYEQPGKDSCNGDSGGPLVASDSAGVPYQTGVVSWGPSNCGGVPKPYGVYTRISAHAQWLRTKVGTLRTVDREAALKARGEAEQRAVLRDAVDELQANLGDGKAAIRLVNWDGKLFKARLNSLYQFEIKSELAGRLIVIDIDAAGKVTQIFPNRFVKSQDLLRIKAGETIKLPTRPRFDFDAFKADEPVGAGKLVLAVVPDDFPVELTLDTETRAQQRKGFVPVADPVAYLVNVLQQIAAQATSRPAGTQSTAARLAYTVVDYEIVR